MLVRRALWFGRAASGLVAAAVVLSAAALASPGASERISKEGGTFRVGMSSALLTSIDPILHGRRHVLDATCGGLMNMPDERLPAGLRVVPEIAAGEPKITNDGRTYTFTIRQGVRFSTGAPVTARSFAHTINRILNPKSDSPFASDWKNIVGAQEVIDGNAATASGIVARGRTLSVRLIKADGSFPTRVTAGNAGFCVVPEDVPIDPEGVKAPAAAAGPYYVAEYLPGERVVLERNRFYRGERPHHVDRFVVDLSPDSATILDRVEDGELDSSFVTAAEFGARAGELARRYGVNRSRFFVAPAGVVAMFVLNMSRPLFKNNVRLRQAVNFAVDRRALLRERGQLAGYLTDQYLSPALLGYRDERIYPLRAPDLATARTLAKGHTRSGRAVLYTASTPLDLAQAQILKANLRTIGLELEIRQFPAPLVFERLKTLGEPFDIGRVGWVPGSPDPSFLNPLFDGRTIGEPGYANWSRFDSPKYNRLLDAASRLPAGPERYRRYGKLDVDIARNAAPAIPYAYTATNVLVSERTGCVVLNPALDLVAVCLK